MPLEKSSSKYTSAAALYKLSRPMTAFFMVADLVGVCEQ
jgi:hypothetical protein